MAIPVDFREFTPTNARMDLLRRLEAAPEEHVEAILSSYELLQRMHDRGVIDLLNGLLSAGDTVVEKLADLADSAEVTSMLRLTFMMTNLLKAMNVDNMHRLLTSDEVKTASLLTLARQATSDDARLGMTVAVGLLNEFGAALRKHREQAPSPNASHGLEAFTQRFFADGLYPQTRNHE